MAKRKLGEFLEDNNLDNCSSDSDNFDECDFDEHQSLLDAYNTDTELEISYGSETETTDDNHIIARRIENRFRAQPRVKLKLKNDSCELDIFRLYFTDNVLEHIVTKNK